MDFESFKQLVFAEAEARGFDKMELYAVEGTGTLLSLPEGDEHHEERSVSFRGTIGGSTGTAYSEQLTEPAARYLVETVLENVKLAGGEEAYYHDGSGDYPPEPAADPALDDPRSLHGLRTAVQAELDARGNLGKTTGVIHGVNRKVRLVNNAGLDVSYSSQYVYCILYMVAERDGVLKDALLYRGGTRLSDIDPRDLVEKGWHKANGYFGAEQVETGTYNIVFPNDTASLLVQGFSIFFAADNVLAGTSLLGDKVGQQVAGTGVTIIDDPLDPRGVFVKPFDAEGQPSVRRTLVENGVLRSFLHSTKTAARFDGAKAGSFHRLGIPFAPAVYPSNFYVAPGDKSLEELLEQLGDGLYVTDVSAYFHGAGINAATGEYSIPATGFVVKNGKIDRPFDGVTIAGSLYDFMNNISDTGNDLLFGLPTSFRPGAPMAHGCYGSPSLRVDGIAVSGK